MGYCSSDFLEDFIAAQSKAPLFEAVNKYRGARVVPFDVPGHKQGKGNPELTDFLGKACLSVDVNSMKPLDNLTHPSGVIKEAEILAAEAFQAAHAFFLVGGTTAAVQAMVLSTCGRGDEIILPRNVHISAINALILSGAHPVYVNPQVNSRLGIPLGMTVASIEEAIREHPGAKAILVNNPTYYGICSSLQEIVRLAHANGIKVLVDEAHGTHFSFGKNLPVSAMQCGADMAAISMHKTGGSLTQSSLLLAGSSMNPGAIRQTINLTQTTSGSYLLLTSLDISRRNLALRGENTFARILSMANYAREEINKIGGFYAYGEELCASPAVHAFDSTKLSVFTRDIGLAGIEVYDILRDDYNIQIELGDIGNILAIISVGDSELEIERLLSALYEIKRLYSKDPAGLFDHEYVTPIVELPPQKAFYSEKKSFPIPQSAGQICGEFVMCYPPGIPILAPGERVTKEIIDYIRYAKEKGCKMTGTEDPEINILRCIDNIVN